MLHSSTLRVPCLCKSRAQIRRKHWYLAALLLPYLLAGLAYMLPDPSWGLLLIAPIGVSGPAYAIFVVVYWVWARDKTHDRIWATRHLLPWLFYPFCFAGFILQLLAMSTFSISLRNWSDILFSLQLLPLVLFYGYFYVALGIGLTKLLTRAGLLHD